MPLNSTIIKRPLRQIALRPTFLAGYGRFPSPSLPRRERRIGIRCAICTVTAILGLLVLCDSGCADVYRWKDTRGQTHYSDHAQADAEKRPIDTQPATNTGDDHIVSRVYDGDTITLDDGTKVRLLGINTPEIEGISKHDEPGGQTARAWLKQRIEKQTVRIQTDAVTRDKYQRLLAHIFTPKGEHINQQLLEEGLATIDIHPPNLAYVDVLAAAEKRAQDARKGLWALPEYQAHSFTAVKKMSTPGWRRLVGTISAVSENKNYQSIELGANSNILNIRVANENLSLFPPLSAYLNHRVEARGWPTCKHESCYMYVKHPSALINLD
jgi:micrococcal nuclease